MRLSNLLILLLSLLFLVILGYIIMILYTTHLYKRHHDYKYKRREYDPVDETVYVYKNDPVWWGGYNVNWGPHNINPYPSQKNNHNYTKSSSGSGEEDTYVSVT